MVRIHAAVLAECTLFTKEGEEIEVKVELGLLKHEHDVYLAPLEYDKQYYWIERDGNAWELHQISSKECVAVKNIIFCFIKGKELSPWRKMRIEELNLPSSIRIALGV